MASRRADRAGKEGTRRGCDTAIALKEVDVVDMHLEVDIIAVSDVERSKQFYGRCPGRA